MISSAFSDIMSLMWYSRHFWCTVRFKNSKLKVILKRNFRMWDFYLIIKFEPHLEILPTFFLRIRQAKTAFPAVRSWPVEPKLAAILARPKQRSDVTVCVTLMPYSTVLLSPNKHSQEKWSNLFVLERNFFRHEKVQRRVKVFFSTILRDKPAVLRYEY